MKTIGILGGTSWPSTIEYYRYLNTRISEKLGGFHSARILLYSLDYDDIKSSYGDKWNAVAPLLKEELLYLAEREPEMILIANNTLHRALDEIGELKIDVPILHIGYLAATEAQRRNMKRILFLGTKFTMENGYFEQLLTGAGLDVVIPTETERDQIQTAQTALAAGDDPTKYTDLFTKLIDDTYADVDGVILGCTELPLPLASYHTPEKLLNTIHIQCDRAIELALS